MRQKVLKDSLAAALRPLYKGMADELKDKSDKVPFMLSFGEKYSESIAPRIFFVGRSTYGWIDHLQWDIDYHFNWEENRGKDDRGFARTNQIKKIVGRKVHSPFWGAIEKVSRSYSYILRQRGKQQQGKWYDNIAWSNVCKVSYKSEVNGNTDSGEALEVQRKWSAMILNKEVECIQPKFVVLFVGKKWLDAKFPNFMDELDARRLDMEHLKMDWGGCRDKSNYKLRVYESKCVYYILTEHPQGKNENEHQKVISRAIRFLLDNDKSVKSPLEAI